MQPITASSPAAKKSPLYKALYFQVLVGLALGITVGHFWPDFGASLKVLGDGFVKLVKMMIGPIVFCTIVSGITSLSDSKEIGKTLVKAMGLFYALTIVALLTGLVAVTVMQPGVGMNIDPTHLDKAVAASYAKQAAPKGFVEFVLHIIPNAFFGAFAEGEVLPVLLLAVICGFGLTKIGVAGKPVLEGINSFAHMLFAAFGLIMKLAPIGAFGAMAFTVGKYGIKSIGSLGMLIVTFYVACGFFVVVVLGLLARFHGFSLWKLLRYIREELLIVLGTSSSEPVLPRLLLKLEKLGCNRGVVGLVLPTGYSFNLDGTAIYLTLASMFIAQACNIDLTMTQIFGMLGLMLLTSKGAAGVTGSGFVALVATLTVMPDLPVAGVALIVGIDRFMSEARALTSTMSNAVACVVVSIWEKACDREVLASELNQGYAVTEQALDDGEMVDATLRVDETVALPKGA
jgi:aerobic C4-dicarboxylate transport protein